MKPEPEPEVGATRRFTSSSFRRRWGATRSDAVGSGSSGNWADPARHTGCDRGRHEPNSSPSSPPLFAASALACVRGPDLRFDAGRPRRLRAIRRCVGGGLARFVGRGPRRLTTGPGTSISVATPAGTVKGDVEIAAIASYGSTVVTAPSGWALVKSQTDTTTTVGHAGVATYVFSPRRPARASRRATTSCWTALQRARAASRPSSVVRQRRRRSSSPVDAVAKRRRERRRARATRRPASPRRRPATCSSGDLRHGESARAREHDQHDVARTRRSLVRERRLLGHRPRALRLVASRDGWRGVGARRRLFVGDRRRDDDPPRSSQEVVADDPLRRCLQPAHRRVLHDALERVGRDADRPATYDNELGRRAVLEHLPGVRLRPSDGLEHLVQIPADRGPRRDPRRRPDHAASSTASGRSPHLLDLLARARRRRDLQDPHLHRARSTARHGSYIKDIADGKG